MTSWFENRRFSSSRETTSLERLRCGFHQNASDDVEAVSLHWGFRVDSRSGRYRQEGGRAGPHPLLGDGAHRGCAERSWSEPTGFTADALVRNHSSAIRIAGIRILPPVASASKCSTRTPSGTVTPRCRRSPAPVTLPSESRLLAFVGTTPIRSGPRPTGAGRGRRCQPSAGPAPRRGTGGI